MHVPRFLRLCSLSILCLLIAAPAARAELVLRLGSPQAAPGATVELEGLLVNDTGNPLSSTMPRELNGQWTDAQGRVTPAHFELRTSSDATNLPTNTFTRTAWTGTVPATAQGLLTLTVQGADDTLLALQVGDAPLLAHAAGAQPAPPQQVVLNDSATPIPATGAQTGAAPAALSPFETFRNALSPYDPIYFALGRTGGTNARFQLSFKYRPFSPADPAHPGFMDNWYLGYTQTSLWDLHSDSIPFIDTTYNPSLFWAQESLVESADKRWAFGLNAGVEHKSNGKDSDDSRSLNDAYLQPEFSYRFDGGSRLSFQPRIKAYFATDRDMGYQDYLGHVDWKLRWAQDNGLALSGLYRQGSRGHATQLEAAWPLQRTFLHMNGYLYVQYFRGYGETLLGYNQKSDPQARIGIALVP
ncbi:phospholipase A [Castellaniella sp.]|uniref:phospholipase A n=1 Tax=Castellaniella sp. TaxID=1955812 RepID=UPI002AFE0584|nr:phospholipase A [Castellaniella sp.]